MTRPDQLKPKEDSVPGTPYAGFSVGAELGPLSFTLTPEIVDEYFTSVEADRSLYKLDGRQAAPPNVLFPYMTAVLYRKFPPIQGIIMAGVDIRFHHPIWADEKTEITVTGKVTNKYEKKGRRYIEWQSVYKKADGTKLATLDNFFNVPA